MAYDEAESLNFKSVACVEDSNAFGKDAMTFGKLQSGFGKV